MSSSMAWPYTVWPGRRGPTTLCAAGAAWACKTGGFELHTAPDSKPECQLSQSDTWLVVPCRIVWGQYRHGVCSDQVGDYKLGEGPGNCPMRSAQQK